MKKGKEIHRKNVSSDSDSDHSVKKDNLQDKSNLEDLKTNDYVIVKYENKYYPGIVEQMDENEIFVSAMCSSKKQWKWPNPPDKLWYKIEDNVMAIINKPKTLSTRGLYMVPEINKYQNVTNNII